jgi:hypothetical protein
MSDSLAASIAFLFASEIIPASATIVTSPSVWAAMNGSIVGTIVVVSARLPSDELDADDDCYIPVALVAVTCEIGPGGLPDRGWKTKPTPWFTQWQLNAAGLDDGTEKATR